MKKFFKKIIYAFFPRRCSICGDVVELNLDKCRSCEYAKRIEGERCDKCGKEKNNCSCKMSHHTPEYERIVAPYYYENNMVKAVHRLKFSGYKELADGMANEIVKTIKEEYSHINFDAVAYIPMAKKRERARGYNQSRLLAQKIAEALDTNLEDTFYKAYENPPQRNQTACQREANVFGAFDVNENINPEGKTYLVIDDVKTTGSTLSECAAVLDSYGAAATYVAVFAIR